MNVSVIRGFIIMFTKVIWVSLFIQTACVENEYYDEERDVVMPVQQLSPYAIKGNLGTAFRFQPVAGQTIKANILDVYVEGGDNYGGMLALSIFPLDPNANFANVTGLIASVQFGTGGALMQGTDFDIGKGVSFNVPASKARVDVSVSAFGGAADLTIGGSVSIGTIVNQSQLIKPVLFTLNAAGTPGDSTVRPALVLFARSMRVYTSDNRNDDIFIELVDTSGTTMYGVHQSPGMEPISIPMLGRANTIKITNLGMGAVAGNILFEIEL
jgi:hypothetical protein